MGGEDSEVTESTRNIFLECALFEPKAIRRRRRALGLSTDASDRYERGVDPDGLERRGAARAGADRRGRRRHGRRDGVDVYPEPAGARRCADPAGACLARAGVSRSMRARWPSTWSRWASGGSRRRWRLRFEVPGHRVYDVDPRDRPDRGGRAAPRLRTFPRSCVRSGSGAVPEAPLSRWRTGCARCWSAGVCWSPGGGVRAGGAGRRRAAPEPALGGEPAAPGARAGSAAPGGAQLLARRAGRPALRDRDSVRPGRNAAGPPDEATHCAVVVTRRADAAALERRGDRSMCGT